MVGGAAAVSLENHVFQQDNAPAHRSAYASDWLKKAGFNNERVMVWSPNSPDLNSMHGEHVGHHQEKSIQQWKAIYKLE